LVAALEMPVSWPGELPAAQVYGEIAKLRFEDADAGYRVEDASA